MKIKSAPANHHFVEFGDLKDGDTFRFVYPNDPTEATLIYMKGEGGTAIYIGDGRMFKCAPASCVVPVDGAFIEYFNMDKVS